MDELTEVDMSCKTVTITHGNEGITFRWSDGTTYTFSNAAYLAEAYAILREAQSESRCDAALAADKVSEIRSMIANNRSETDVEKAIDNALAALNTLQRTIDCMA